MLSDTLRETSRLLEHFGWRLDRQLPCRDKGLIVVASRKQEGNGPREIAASGQNADEAYANLREAVIKNAYREAKRLEHAANKSLTDEIRNRLPDWDVHTAWIRLHFGELALHANASHLTTGEKLFANPFSTIDDLVKYAGDPHDPLTLQLHQRYPV